MTETDLTVLGGSAGLILNISGQGAVVVTWEQAQTLRDAIDREITA